MPQNTERPSDQPCRSDTLTLGIAGFTFRDLYDPARLAELLRRFMDDLEHRDPAIGLRYRELLETGNPTRDEETWVVMNVGPHLARFVGTLFGVGEQQQAILARTRALDVIFRVRRDFVRRRVLKKVKPADVAVADLAALGAEVRSLSAALGQPQAGEHPELAFCRMVAALLDLEIDLDSARDHGESELQLAAVERHRLAVLRAAVPGFPAGPEIAPLEAAVDAVLQRVQLWTAAQAFVAASGHGAAAAGAEAGWVVFRQQLPMHFQDLVRRGRPRPDLPELFEGPHETFRRRDGFKLTDPRMDAREVFGEVDTCIFCHEQGRDTCAKGHLEKNGAAKKNPLGIALDGCPLDEHISEAHLHRQRGDAVAALAAVMVNNPMCPGTGHRICNDCMKACIFQKQDPVNIPQIETSILTDVLRLRNGPEIFGFLTRWNPLNLRRPYQRPLNGKKVLVVGLGPAGYTLSHYLTNEGFGVVAIDGLKLEPLPDHLGGERFEPLPAWDDFIQALDERTLEGFGGVSEYGITVRWDKNFLRLLHVTLARKQGLRMIGGVRFGGTLTLEDAAELGFDHVAIASGAGKPTVVPMRNNLIRGVRQASDFLMALQLTGAAKDDSLANLQVALPAVVVGGGLTAIDTATELAAYYPLMVERVLKRTDLLRSEGRLEAYEGRLAPDERDVYATFLEHGRAVRAERERAKAAGEAPDFAALVRGWGGVTIAYRKTMQDSPAYRLNHEEVIKCLEEGIFFFENVSPVEAVPDEHGRIKALRLERATAKDVVELPCRSLMIAAGTSPNTIYEREHPGSFELDGKFFKPFTAAAGEGAVRLDPAKDRMEAFFTSYRQGGLTVSYYGDNHPAYAGNVVKAMASARNGFPKVVDLFRRSITNLDPATQPVRDRSFRDLAARLEDELCPRVERVVRLTPTITEVVLRAPYQARKFEPGQFYRLQDFESRAPKVKGIRLAMEGVALTGAWVDKDQGLLSLIILEMGGSSSLCAALKPGQRVVCMGPTGTPTEIPRGENVVLLGGGLGNAVLFSIAKALRDAGSKVLYFAGYKNGIDLFKREEIEAATDQVIWSTDAGDPIVPRRPQDRHFRGNIVQAMIAYSNGELGPQAFPLRSAKRLIAIGSDRMMAAVKAARHDPARLAPHLCDHVAIGSINSPMQCMMKEVCAQCLQRHVDPKTGAESFVFSCFNQDQHLDEVDFAHLNLRLRQNGVLEKLSAATIALLLESSKLPRV